MKGLKRQISLNYFEKLNDFLFLFFYLLTQSIKKQTQYNSKNYQYIKGSYKFKV